MSNEIWENIYRAARNTEGYRIDFFGTVTLPYHKLLATIKKFGWGHLYMDQEIKKLNCDKIFFEDNRKLGIHAYYISINNPEV